MGSLLQSLLQQMTRNTMVDSRVQSVGLQTAWNPMVDSPVLSI